MPTTVDQTVKPVSRLAQVRRITSSRLAAPIACGCCLAAGAVYVAAVNPEGRGGFLPCPFRSLTGWWCPGCGLTRAAHFLFRGDLTQALRYNLFVVVVLIAAVVSWMMWMRRALSGNRGQPRPSREPRSGFSWITASAIAVAVAFALLRNLPVIDGLRG
jgi:hypothetical protein